MTIETIRIELNRAEGAVLRLLGLIERRGFAVRGVTMPPADPLSNSPVMEMTVSVQARQAGRCVENLACHLRKLWDIERVTLMDEFHGRAEPMPAPPGNKETVSCAL